MSKTLLEQAIAEAKEVRKTALENAKLALEESMTSKLQHMFSTKLSEEMEEEDAEDLDEVLREADDDKASDDDAETEEDTEEVEDTETDDTEVEDTEVEDVEDVDSKDVKDLSVEELKDVIRDIVQTELAGEVTPGDETMGDMPVDDSMVGGETDLENTDVAPTLDDEFDGSDVPVEGEDDEDIDLDEVLAELEAINNAGDNIKEAATVKKNVIKKSTNKATGAPGFKKVGDLKLSESKKLNEAYRTINTLRTELKETNLLNAKLIYVNSIFKGKSLTESQKLKVIEKFDEATTIKEAKLVFQSLMESFRSKPSTKKLVRESLGFASKSAGVAGKKPIVAVDETVARFQQLAGITKPKF